MIVESDSSQNRSLHGWRAAVLTLTALAAFARTLQGGFVWDDLLHIVHDPAVREIVDWPHYLTAFGSVANAGHPGPYYRPLFQMSLAADYQLWGLNPFGFHLTNLVLHTLTALLVCAVGLQLGLHLAPALGAALLFAVHPVQTESVAYISARADLLCTLFLLCVAALWLAALERAGPNRWWRLGMALAAYALALLSKELALAGPALMLVYAAVRTDSRRRARLWAALPFVALAALYLAWRWTDWAATAATDSADWVRELPRLSVIFAHDLRLLVFPFRLNSMYIIPVPRGWAAPEVGASLVLAVVYAAAVVTAWRRAPAIALALLWIVIGLLPVLNPIYTARLSSPMAEQFLYAPSIGFAWLVAGGFERARVRLGLGWNAARALAGVGLVVCAVSVWKRTADWKDDLTVFTRMSQTAPKSPMAFNHLGSIYRGRGQLGRAIRVFERAVGLNPLDADIRLNLGLAYQESGRLDQAVAELRRSEALRPGQPEAQARIRQILLQRAVLPGQPSAADSAPVAHARAPANSTESAPRGMP